MLSQHANNRLARSALALILAWGLGTALGTFLSGQGATAGSCGIDRRSFSNDAQNVSDTGLDGDDDDNRWTMHGGRDTALTLACDDGVTTEFGVEGQGENDEVGGGSGFDWVSGGLNNDTVRGGASPQSFTQADHLFGDDGPDSLFDLESNDPDDLQGGDGGDLLQAQDGDSSDLLNGGPGTDDCHFDGGDTLQSC